jgi:hypothetical protein
MQVIRDAPTNLPKSTLVPTGHFPGAMPHRQRKAQTPPCGTVSDTELVVPPRRVMTPPMRPFYFPPWLTSTTTTCITTRSK